MQIADVVLDQPKLDLDLYLQNYSGMLYSVLAGPCFR